MIDRHDCTQEPVARFEIRSKERDKAGEAGKRKPPSRCHVAHEGVTASSLLNPAPLVRVTERVPNLPNVTRMRFSPGTGACPLRQEQGGFNLSGRLATRRERRPVDQTHKPEPTTPQASPAASLSNLKIAMWLSSEYSIWPRATALLLLLPPPGSKFDRPRSPTVCPAPQSTCDGGGGGKMDRQHGT